MRKKKSLKKISCKLVFLVPICLLVITIMAISGCASFGNRTEVTIEVKNVTGVDFEKYEQIVYQDLTIEGLPQEFNPDNIINNFFLDEFPKLIEKKVEHFGKDQSEIPANALLVNGTLKLEIKERSKIKEIDASTEETKKAEEKETQKETEIQSDEKDSGTAGANSKEKTGKESKKKRVFITVKHWTLNLTVVMKDTASGNEVFKGDFEEKLVDEEGNSNKFNFEDWFYKVSNKLVKKMTKTRKMQRRYLLL